MKERPDELIELFKPLREELPEGASADAHPFAEELVAYQHGQLSPAGEQHLQEHFILCASCTQLLLDLASFPELESAAPRHELTDEDVAARWPRVRGQLKDAERAEAQATPPTPLEMPRPSESPAQSESPLPFEKRRSFTRSFYIPYAVAASLLVAAVALALWGASLRRENAQLAARLRESEETAASFNQKLAERERAGADAERALAEARGESARRQEEAARRAQEDETEIAELRRARAPRTAPAAPQRSGAEIAATNVPAFDLYPEEALRGEGGNVKTIEAPRGARRLSFTLNSASRAAFDSYRVEVAGADSKAVWSRAGLRKNAAGSFNVTLPARLLAAGQYRFRLYGMRAGADAEKFEEFTVRITYR